MAFGFGRKRKSHGEDANAAKSGHDVHDKNVPPIHWLEADQNPWGVRVLDVRPVTLGMLSTSKDPRCASNAISFGSDDGTSFIGVAPNSDRSTPASLNYPIDGFLADGALFVPNTMEHKWAIFLHRGSIIFVRSWQRHVAATAEVHVDGQVAHVTAVHGFLTDEDAEPELTVRVTDYLIRSHALGTAFPAPLTQGIAESPEAAALWCMSLFGKMAAFATPHSIPASPSAVPLRTHSLLHIAVARGDETAAAAQLDLGVPVGLLAQDGLAPLHWSLACKDTRLADMLLKRGSDVDVQSAEGATPLMNAVQGGSGEWVEFFLSRGAYPNARDHRGFTALHRAAEMGKADLVRRLLDAGATANVEADRHTPLSLAQARKHNEIIRLLTQR
jgi:hypothetical protein